MDSSEILKARWYAMPEDTIGGWCIMTTPNPPSTGLGWEVATFMFEEVAEEIAKNHNSRLVFGLY